MRSVPHRVVCLLGLDDGAFPRRPRATATTCCSPTPHVGDRDPRTEDRQLLLDALLAAREHADHHLQRQRRAHQRAAAAGRPVGELLDAVDATARRAGDVEAPARDQVVVRHPLQPFDPRNFIAGRAACRRAPWSFDAVALAGRARASSARATRRRRSSPRRCRRRSTPATLALDELVGVRRAAGARVPAPAARDLGARRRATRSRDALPVELDALERWGVGQRLLDGAARRHRRHARSRCAEIARGTLPPGALGEPVIARDVADRRSRSRAPPGLRRRQPSPGRSRPTSRSPAGRG